MKIKVKASKCDTCDQFAVVVDVNSQDLTNVVAARVLAAWRNHLQTWDAFALLTTNNTNTNTSTDAAPVKNTDKYAALLARLLPTHPQQGCPLAKSENGGNSCIAAPTPALGTDTTADNFTLVSSDSNTTQEQQQEKQTVSTSPPTFSTDTSSTTDTKMNTSAPNTNTNTGTSPIETTTEVNFSEASSAELWFAGACLDMSAPIGTKFGFNEKTQVNVELRLISKACETVSVSGPAVHMHPEPMNPAFISAIQDAMSSAKALAKTAQKQDAVEAKSNGKQKQQHHQNRGNKNARGGAAGGAPHKHADEILLRETRQAEGREIRINSDALKRLREDPALVKQLSDERLKKVLRSIDGADYPRVELENRLMNDADLRAFLDSTLVTLGAAQVVDGHLQVDVATVME